ncbi:hypothetical protein BDN70DRAFT_949751 [Pholiota conissans]|uniref:Uncharacterized protein n=1 Tax=Pholiota conissans TaxID=109636 RepID=A0A9P5YZR3_9AGAR|nr:hypothetical protein BDN70DRAFT_949751 [Pholiota conissans]
MPRYLKISASGLNSAEYPLFTSNLESMYLFAGATNESIEKLRRGDSDSRYDQVEVHVCDVKDWVRRKYRHLSKNTIDKILRRFSPDLAVEDTMKGRQFFAMMRLIVHVENGMPLKSELVFEQTMPSYTSIQTGDAQEQNTAYATIKDEDLHREHPRQKKVQLKKVDMNNRVTLARDNPLRCASCTRKDMQCKINPANIPVLVEWMRRDRLGWTPRPRFTSCLHCRSKGSSCRLPWMTSKKEFAESWKTEVVDSLERIEDNVDKILVKVDPEE